MASRQGGQAERMSIKRYTAAGSGVMRTDPKGGYVNYSDYLELQNQPDALTAYLYAAELGKEDRKILKDEVKRLTLLQAETLNERNKAEAKVKRLRKAGDAMLALWEDTQSGHWAIDDAKPAWNAAKEGKPTSNE